MKEESQEELHEQKSSLLKEAQLALEESGLSGRCVTVLFDNASEHSTKLPADANLISAGTYQISLTGGGITGRYGCARMYP